MGEAEMKIEYKKGRRKGYYKQKVGSGEPSTYFKLLLLNFYIQCDSKGRVIWREQNWDRESLR